MILRNIGGTLASILVALGLLFVVSEIALRIYMHYAIFYDVEMARYANEFKLTASDPRIGHVHKPNSEGRLMGVTVRINADGLRDADYPVPRGDGYRIIFLGDSLTFGWGVRKEETFESLIEAKATIHNNVNRFWVRAMLIVHGGRGCAEGEIPDTGAAIGRALVASLSGGGGDGVGAWRGEPCRQGSRCIAHHDTRGNARA